jgi:hypothetical protein
MGASPLQAPISLKKEGRIWTADFIAPAEVLKIPGICFVFNETAHVMENGKSVMMPSADLYEINLRDFLKPAPDTQK